jgi:hypothetical protein
MNLTDIEVAKIVGTIAVAVLPMSAVYGYQKMANWGVEKLCIQDFGLEEDIESDQSMTQYLGDGGQRNDEQPPELREEKAEELNILKREERGSRPICWAVRRYRHIPGRIEEFIIIQGKIQDIKKDLQIDLPKKGSRDPNVLFCAKCITPDGYVYEPILYHPVDPRETAQLIDLRDWVRNQATIFGQWATLAAVGFWTTVSLWGAI